MKVTNIPMQIFVTFIFFNETLKLQLGVAWWKSYAGSYSILQDKDPIQDPVQKQELSQDPKKELHPDQDPTGSYTGIENFVRSYTQAGSYKRS